MSDAAGVAGLIGRLLFVYWFVVVTAPGHFKNDKMLRGFAKESGFPLPALAGWATGLWLTLGGFSVALGIWPDLGALMLGAITIPTAAFFHRFWTNDDEMQKTLHTQLFYRNVTFLGAALVFFGTFVALGSELRFTITGPFFDF
jgi:putative oxidoreductase